MPGNRGIFKVMLKKGIPIKMQESLALQSSLTGTVSHFLLYYTIATGRTYIPVAPRTLAGVQMKQNSYTLSLASSSSWRNSIIL